MPELPAEQKRQILESRLSAFALDAYGHELNRAAAIAVDDSEAVTVADLALVTIATTTATYEAELAALPVEAPTE
jgi:hypothetical protein